MTTERVKPQTNDETDELIEKFKSKGGSVKECPPPAKEVDEDVRRRSLEGMERDKKV